MNSDFKELLQTLNDHDVRYLVVGGYAVMHYTEPRFTKDLDVWLEPSTANALRTARALTIFGIPLVEVTEADLATPGTQLMVGIPPCAIDLLTSCSNLVFTDCWQRRTMAQDGSLVIPFLAKHDLIEAKEASRRHQDLADLEKLLLPPISDESES